MGLNSEDEDDMAGQQSSPVDSPIGIHPIRSIHARSHILLLVQVVPSLKIRLPAFRRRILEEAAQEALVHSSRVGLGVSEARDLRQ